MKNKTRETPTKNIATVNNLNETTFGSSESDFVLPRSLKKLLKNEYPTVAGSAFVPPWIKKHRRNSEEDKQHAASHSKHKNPLYPVFNISSHRIPLSSDIDDVNFIQS
jgi:hypothetical protein